MGAAEGGGAVALEGIHLGAEDEHVGGKHAVEGGTELLGERAVLGSEVEKRDRRHQGEGWRGRERVRKIRKIPAMAMGRHQNWPAVRPRI